MSIIDRLLMREVFKTLAVILLVLLLVLLASLLVKLLGRAAHGAIGADVLLTLVGLEIIKTIGLLLPPAYFFSLLWVLGSMYRDSEMVALQSGGFGMLRLLRSVGMSAAPLILLSAALSFYLIPWAKYSIDQIKLEQRESTDIGGVRGGRFNEFKRGNLVVYTEGHSELGGLRRVFVQDRQHDRLGVVMAEHAYQATDPGTGERFIVLADGRRYEGMPGQGDFRIAGFDEYAIRVPRVNLEDQHFGVDAQPTAKLWGQDALSVRTEIQSRLSVPGAMLVFVLFALPLSRAPPRRDVFGRIGLAILVYFLVINLQRVAERWMELGVTPAWMGQWWFTLLMLVLGGVLILFDSGRLAGYLRRLRSVR